MRETLMAVLCAAVLPPLLAACSPFTVLNATGDGGHLRAEGVAYGPEPGQLLDVYAPAGASASGTGLSATGSPAAGAPAAGAPAAGTPVVVFFYGGSWRSGSRSDYAFVGAALAARGIVTMVADYRRYPQAVYPAFLYDSARAVAWTLAHAARYGGDPARVFVAGHSAGAYNAAMVALDARWLSPCGVTPGALAGWIGMAGPYDFLPLTSRSLQAVFPYPGTPADTQPIRHVSAGAPPALLLVGRADTTVDPVRNTDGLAQALRQAGAEVRVTGYERLGHGLLVGALAPGLRWRAPVLDDIVRFVAATPALPAASASGMCADTGLPQ
ncbi:alpha/beta hydrolase [Pseudomonadota bacterium AL_CKDN230030165-1A_HGKHYDSX7]